MKSKKGSLLTFVALVLVSAVALYAGGEEKWAKLKAELSLTDAQVTQLQEKFKSLNPLMEKAEALHKEIETLEKATPPDQKAIDAKRSELMSYKKEWKAKADAIYKSVLTSEQMHKLEEMQAKYEKEKSAKK